MSWCCYISIAHYFGKRYALVALFESWGSRWPWSMLLYLTGVVCAKHCKRPVIPGERRINLGQYCFILIAQYFGRYACNWGSVWFVGLEVIPPEMMLPLYLGRIICSDALCNWGFVRVIWLNVILDRTFRNALYAILTLFGFLRPEGDTGRDIGAISWSQEYFGIA